MPELFCYPWYAFSWLDSDCSWGRLKTFCPVSGKYFSSACPGSHIPAALSCFIRWAPAWHFSSRNWRRGGSGTSCWAATSLAPSPWSTRRITIALFPTPPISLLFGHPACANPVALRSMSESHRPKEEIGRSFCSFLYFYIESFLNIIKLLNAYSFIIFLTPILKFPCPSRQP